MKRSRIERRTPLRAGKGLERRTRLRSKPSRRARPEEPLAERCEANVPGECTGRPEERHHILRRSQGGGDGPENTLDVCRRCHDWIGDNPMEAASRGLARFRMRDVS